jgi:hypothetical protein
MTRLVFQASLLCKTLVLMACMAGLLCVQPPPAQAQHVGGHVGGPGARTYVPPPSRIPGPRPVFGPAPRVSQFGVSQFGPGAYLYRPWGPWGPRRFPPVFAFGFPFQFGAPFWFLGGWGYNPCWWLNCYLYWNLGYSYNPTPWTANTAQNYVQPQSYQYQLYAYGPGSRDFPQLYLNDGAAITVSDYWLVDNQLHFIAMEGAKPAEHTIPLDQLDLQSTIDVNTRRGFRFVQRNEPMDQWVRDHPKENPPDWPVPKQ